MNRKRFNVLALVLLLFVFLGCAELNEFTKEMADVVAPHDIVTGQRSLNMEAEEAEIKRATEQTESRINENRVNGTPVDTDQAALARLQDMTRRIAKISHRPQLPWEIHLIENKEDGAFTIGGGKLFVESGLFGGLVSREDDDELAAVLAHEMAHVTCRHVGKTEAMQLAAMISKKARNARDSKLYQACFTTVQEDEADRVGLLYMALAGYDPRATQRIWQRAHQREGSDPNNYNYLYDHSLNIDRMKKVGELVPLALKYYKGEGIINEDYDRLRTENELVPRTGSFAGDNGLLAVFEASLGVYSDHLKAKNEELSRELSMQQAQVYAYARTHTRITFQRGNTQDGHVGIFGRLQNIGDGAIENADITIYYCNSVGKVIYAQIVTLQHLNLSPGNITNWSAYMLDVPGSQNFGAAVTKIDIAAEKSPKGN